MALALRVLDYLTLATIALQEPANPTTIWVPLKDSLLEAQIHHLQLSLIKASQKIKCTNWNNLRQNCRICNFWTVKCTIHSQMSKIHLKIRQSMNLVTKCHKYNLMLLVLESTVYSKAWHRWKTFIQICWTRVRLSQPRPARPSSCLQWDLTKSAKTLVKLLGSLAISSLSI